MGGLARSYSASCPIARITVNGNSSGSGLDQLEKGNVQVADSELTPSEAERPAHDLWENRVAIAVFAVVLNRSVANVTSLTRARIAQIYAGSITNWGQVGGPDLEITVVGRTADSGTHYVFSRSFVAYVARNVRSDTTFIDIRDAGDAMASHE